MTRQSAEDTFWALTQPMLGKPSVARSTMMGLPCLRVSGQFFASFDRRTDSIVVKLPAARVNDLIASGQAEPFAPSGRRFREWAAIDQARHVLWTLLLDEALAFVADSGVIEQYDTTAEPDDDQPS